MYAGKQHDLLFDCCSGSAAWPGVWLVMLARERLLGMMLSILGGGFHLRLAHDWPWNSWSVKDSNWPRRLVEGGGVEREEERVTSCHQRLS